MYILVGLAAGFIHDREIDSSVPSFLLILCSFLRPAQSCHVRY